MPRAARCSRRSAGERTPRAAVMVGLDVARPVHARWIEHRIAGMFDSGGIQDEVRWLPRQRATTARRSERAASATARPSTSSRGTSTSRPPCRRRCGGRCATPARSAPGSAATRGSPWFRPGSRGLRRDGLRRPRSGRRGRTGSSRNDAGLSPRTSVCIFRGARATFRVAQAGWRMFQHQCLTP